MTSLDEGMFDGWKTQWEGQKGAKVGDVDPPPLSIVVTAPDGTPHRIAFEPALTPEELESKLSELMGGATARRVVEKYRLDEPDTFRVPDSS